MKFTEIHEIVGSVPFISKENAHFLYNLILKEKVTNILELGIAHGTATCYMAAALQELGRGKIASVDLIDAKYAFVPSVEEQLSRAGLTEYVTVKRMQTGYNWFLHDEIKANSNNAVCTQIYDLCIIDGPKNWTIDGAAFFLVDKLLKHNGWIIFDDYLWTYADADRRRDSTDGITHRALSREEQETPHIREVFELLVKQHAHYGNLLVSECTDWAMAQKTNSPNKTYTITSHITFGGYLFKAIRSVLSFLVNHGKSAAHRRPRL